MRKLNLFILFVSTALSFQDVQKINRQHLIIQGQPIADDHN